MATDPAKIAEIEAAAAAAPQAQDIARKAQDEQKKALERRDDLQRRMFCIEQATKACAAGGYDVQDIVRLTSGFYQLLTGNAALPPSVATETSSRKPLAEKANRSVS